MAQRDPKEWRVLPGTYAARTHEETPAARFDTAARRLPALAEALTAHTPRALGIVLPFSWQMHFLAYREASERGVKTAIAMTSNVAPLSGLMRSLPIEAVIASSTAAVLIADDLRSQGLLERIKVWVILQEAGDTQSFSVPTGEVVYEILP